MTTDTDNKIDPTIEDSPYAYQMSVVKYLAPNTPYRSLLAYHGLGSGKTRTAILLSILFIKDGKKIIFLVPGALRGNVYEQLYIWGPENIRIPNYDKLSTEERKEQEKASNKVIDYYYDILTYNERGLYTKLRKLVNPETGMIEDRLIIVDEIHDFVSRMAKPTNLSRKVYHFLMDKLVNCKILGLSGTPLLNSAHELGILYNVLRGKMQGDNTLFPENEEYFNDKFVSYFDRSVSNQYLFKRRISGLTSFFAGAADLTTMPEKIYMPTEIIEMSDHQYKLYLSERYSESKKESKKKSSVSEGSSSGSAFRTYSRMVSNFSFPEAIDRPKPISSQDFRSYEKFKNHTIKTKNIEQDVADEIKPDQLDSFQDDEGSTEEEQEERVKGLSKKQRQLTYLKMLDSAFQYLKEHDKEIFSKAGLEKYSRKMLRIADNIEKAPGSQGLVYIYTEFRMLEGVRIMGAVLEFRGYQKIDLSQVRSMNELKKLGPGLRYGVISSTEDESQRKILLDIFRHKDNSHGEYLKVVIGTAASSQGINMKRVTQVHLMEDYWNDIRREQVEGRAARLNSHTDLPKEERKVYIYVYRMVLNEEQQKDIIKKLDNTKEKTSTEEYIFDLAQTKAMINSQFLKMAKEAAFDCNLNYLVNVQRDPDLVCLDVPEDSGKYMFLPNIEEDPVDYEYQKRIKFEVFLPAKKVIQGITYGYKVYQNGKPFLTQLTIRGRIHPQVIILYDYELLKNNIEVKKKYYILGTNKLLDPSEIL